LRSDLGKMKILLKIILFSPAMLLVCTTTSFAQSFCNKFSLGDFFDKLKSLRPIKSELLSYRRFDHFDFEHFKPIGDVRDSSFVSIGCDQKGDIREIVFKGPKEVFSLSVYDFEWYRILLLKRPTYLNEFLYTPTAIFNSKNNDENYMLNVKAQFRNDYDAYELFDSFPITDLNQVSCLMKLDKDLYPHEMVKFSNMKIVLYSGFKYEFERSHKLELEMMCFFIDADHYYKNLDINENSCMKEIIDRIINLRTESNLIVFSKPGVFNETQSPIWIFSGAHRYHLSEK